MTVADDLAPAFSGAVEAALVYLSSGRSPGARFDVGPPGCVLASVGVTRSPDRLYSSASFFSLPAPRFLAGLSAGSGEGEAAVFLSGFASEGPSLAQGMLTSHLLSLLGAGATAESLVSAVGEAVVLSVLEA